MDVLQPDGLGPRLQRGEEPLGVRITERRGDRDGVVGGVQYRLTVLQYLSQGFERRRSRPRVLSVEPVPVDLAHAEDGRGDGIPGRPQVSGVVGAFELDPDALEFAGEALQQHLELPCRAALPTAPRGVDVRRPAGDRRPPARHLVLQAFDRVGAVEEAPETDRVVGLRSAAQRNEDLGRLMGVLGQDSVGGVPPLRPVHVDGDDTALVRSLAVVPVPRPPDVVTVLARQPVMGLGRTRVVLVLNLALHGGGEPGRHARSRDLRTRHDLPL